MKIICHLGVHKTGTTLLQSSLQKNRKLAKDQSIELIVRDRHPIIKNNLRKFVKGDLSRKEMDIIWGKFLNHCGNTKVSTLVVSDENLIGEAASVHYKRKDKNLFYPVSNKRITKLHNLFGQHKVTYLLYTRKQETIMKSLYMDGLKYLRYSVSLDEFIEACLNSTFSFSALTDTLTKIVSPNEVKVLKFEKLKQNPKQFLLEFWEEIINNVKKDKLKLVNKSINPSISEMQADILRLINKTNPKNEDKIALRKWVSNMPYHEKKSQNYVLSSPQLTKIRQTYSNDLSYT